ncbi:MAG: PKD domain-containing protein, partial [Lentisphaerales bacterium]|nr:PKD domain-containing protein [Lentisphaerales bacterium]
MRAFVCVFLWLIFPMLSFSTEIDFDANYRGQDTTLEVDIINAFNAADDGDIILFKSDVTFLLTSQISTTKAVGLRGEPGVSVVFDGQNQTRLICYNLDGRLDAGTANGHYDLNIENVTFQNGNTVSAFDKVTLNADKSLSVDDNSGSHYTLFDYVNELTDTEKAKYYALNTNYTDVTHNGAGGALYVYGANLNLLNVVIKNSFSLGFGAGLYSRFGNTSIINSTIENNVVSQVDDRPYAKGGGAYVDAYSKSYVLNWNLKETYTNNSFSNNTARAAAINDTGYAVGYIQGSALCTYTGANEATRTKNFTNNNFANNQISAHNDGSYGSNYIEGGAFYLSGGVVDFSENNISGTTIIATSNSTAISTSYSSGSRIEGTGAHIYATDVTFSKNEIYNNTSTSSAVSINSNESCYAQGGGLYYSSQGGQSNSIFSKNEIYDNFITTDSANSSHAAGSGIYSYITGSDSSVKFSKNFIRGNTAITEGETINTRSQGGGIYTDNFASTSLTTYTRNSICKNSLISNGTSDTNCNGGGVYSQSTFGTSATINFTSNTIAGNTQQGSNSSGGTARCSGAGIYVANNTDLELYYNTIVGNTQSGTYKMGSGFYNAQYNSDINSQVIHGNIIAFNESGENQYYSGGHIETGANNLIGESTGYPGLTGDIDSSSYTDFTDLAQVINGADGVTPKFYNPIENSDLIDAGQLPLSPPADLDTDQLGNTTSGSERDIGSVENFSLILSVDFSAGSNGSITGDLFQDIDYSNNTSAVSATPDAGYYFHSWEVLSGSYDGVVNTSLTTDNPIIVSNVISDLSLQANFYEDVNYTVNYISAPNGSVDITSQVIRNRQDASPVTAVPHSGYEFLSWSGDISSTDNPLTINDVQSNLNVTANFQAKTYTLTFNSAVNGTISGSTPQVVAHGDSSSSVTAVPSSGYVFSHWTEGANVISTNPLTVNNVVSGATHTAYFVLAPIASFPYSEGFESGDGGWEHSVADDGNWTRYSGSTGSSGTGPTSASEGSYYFYVESSSPYYPSKRFLLSRAFDFSTVNQPIMTFDSHMYGNAMGTLILEASTNGGTIWNTLWSKSGNQPNLWVKESVSLSSVAGQSNVILRFNGLTGSNYTSDMAVDNIAINENQAPVVDLGADRHLARPSTLSLSPTVTDDSPAIDLAYTWSMESGPASVTFSAASSKNTEVTFHTAGDYVLRLTVNEGSLSDFDDVSVTVDPLPDYSVQFFAGANGSLSGDTNQTVTEEANSTPVTVFPDAGYYFNKWEVTSGTYTGFDNSHLATDNPLIGQNILNDVSFTAE